MKLFRMIPLLALAGCAGSPPPETEHYLLRSDAGIAANGELIEIGVGSVHVASYIDRSGIVVETAGGTMRPANNHQWAEPLREGLRTFLADEISGFLGQPVRPGNLGDTKWREYTQAVVDIEIHELHGTLDGTATLSARWAVVDPAARNVLTEHSFARQEALRADGYRALVDAEKRLLSDLAEAIAQSLEPLTPAT